MVKTEKNWFATSFAPPIHHISQGDHGYKEGDAFKKKISHFIRLSSRVWVSGFVYEKGWSRVCITNNCTDRSCAGTAIIERLDFFGSYRSDLFDEQRTSRSNPCFS